jgi:hypothetical protein
VTPLRRAGTIVLCVALALVLAPAEPLAQRGGRGRGAPSMAPQRLSRLEILTNALALDRDQKNTARTILDAAFKAAAPIRTDMAASRDAITAAMTTGGAPEDVTAAIRVYARHATAMTALEMQTLAKILAPLTPAQKKGGTATAFFLMRGIFLNDRRWDEVPTGRMY